MVLLRKVSTAHRGLDFTMADKTPLETVSKYLTEEYLRGIGFVNRGDNDDYLWLEMTRASHEGIWLKVMRLEWDESDADSDDEKEDCKSRNGCFVFFWEFEVCGCYDDGFQLEAFNSLGTREELESLFKLMGFDPKIEQGIKRK